MTSRAGIPFTLIRKQVKNINLRINTKGEVTVSANERIPLARIAEFVNSKEAFILKALAKIKESETQLPTLADGTSIKYLGDTLTVNSTNLPIKAAYAADGQVFVFGDTATRKSLIELWQKKECLHLLLPLVDKYSPFYKNSPPIVKIRAMKTRWGSCKPTGNTITLNTHLIEYPIQAIEYVIVHELAHFIVPNHSAAFYAEISRVMPDYKQRKKLLK